MRREEERQLRRYGQEGTQGLKKANERLAHKVANNIAYHKSSQSVDRYDSSRGGLAGGPHSRSAVRQQERGYLAYQSILNESSRGKYIGLDIPPRPKAGVSRPYMKRSRTTPSIKLKKLETPQYKRSSSSEAMRTAHSINKRDRHLSQSMSMEPMRFDGLEEETQSLKTKKQRLR